MFGLRIAANNKGITSYQSLPLNKWVHVAATIDMTAGDTTAQKIWFDGVEVARSYALTGVAAALVQGTTALVVGAEKSAGTNPFPGKIAQAAVFSTQLADATIKAMMNQTMTGSETGLVSAYTFNNSINDLSANANNLTAQGSAVATNADTPFTNPVTGTSVTAGTTNYGIIMAQTFSTNTTYTIQIPEGETLPTTGGIGTVSYSAQKTPYGFPDFKPVSRSITIPNSQASITSVVDVLGASMTVYIPSGTRIRISTTLQLYSASGDMASVSIMNGATTIKAVRTLSGSATSTNTVIQTPIFTPVSGDNTYKLTVARVTGAGSITVDGPTSPTEFTIEEI